MSGRVTDFTRFFGAVALIMAVAAGSAKAQSATFTFVGETAGDDISMLLGEADFVFGMGEWRPVVGLQSFIIMDELTDRRTLWAITPSVGLRYATPVGFFQGKVGYSWTDAEEPVFFFGGGETGVTTSLHGEYWGDGRYGLQGIGSYNWGAEYLWTRARGTVALMPTRDGAVQGGLEAGWQGHIQDRATLETSYSAITVGPVLQWVMPNVTAGLGAGWKHYDRGSIDGTDSTWYARAELVFSPW
jgi:hypothetical protein